MATSLCLNNSETSLERGIDYTLKEVYLINYASVYILCFAFVLFLMQMYITVCVYILCTWNKYMYFK